MAICIYFIMFILNSIFSGLNLQVMINIPSLPSINSPDRLKCVFGDYTSTATMEDTQVICQLPTSEYIPPTPETQGESILFAFNFNNLLL